MGAPSEQQIREWAERFVARYNAHGGAEIIDEFSARDGVFHFPGSSPIGHESLKQRFERLFKANTDIKLSPEDVIVAGDTLVVRWSLSATARKTGERWEYASITISRLRATDSPEGKEVVLEAEAWDVGVLQPWDRAAAADRGADR